MTPRNQETANINQGRPAARDPFRARATDPDAGDLDGSRNLDEPRRLDEPRHLDDGGPAGAVPSATPADEDTVPEGEWVAGSRDVPPATDTTRLGAPATGAHAAPAAATPAGSGASPGAATTGATLVTNADEYRASWVRIQSGFVDDPQASVTEAADLVAQISGSLVSAVRERERTLRGSWESGGNADTEALRNALREYRSFLERLMRV